MRDLYSIFYMIYMILLRFLMRISTILCRSLPQLSIVFRRISKSLSHYLQCFFRKSPWFEDLLIAFGRFSEYLCLYLIVSFTKLAGYLQILYRSFGVFLFDYPVSLDDYPLIYT